MSAGCEGGSEIQGKNRVPRFPSIGWRGCAVQAAGEALRSAAGLAWMFLQLLGARQSPGGQCGATAELRPEVPASSTSENPPLDESRACPQALHCSSLTSAACQEPLRAELPPPSQFIL